MSELVGNERKKCQICVGCGRCADTVSGLHVITESFLKPKLLPAGETAGKGFFVLVDLGTTTIAMELYDEAGKRLDQYVSPNPQRIFGADVISRIQAAENVMNARQMQALVREVLERGLQQFREQAQVTSIDNMYLMGNTTMMYLLCGHAVQSLGCAPFHAEFLQSEEVRVGGVKAVTLPGLSAFVGGDVMAGVLATGMYKNKEISLLIDLGTNGELVLGNKEKMIACSTAAGPAFEGMLYANGQAVWGADIVNDAACLLQYEIMDETGLLKEPYFTEGIVIGGTRITQDNIRSLQTAKAAVATGIELLAQEYGLSNVAEIDKVYLAGGFGYYLQQDQAIQIGLLPGELYGRIQTVGNSALAGGYYYHFCCEREQETKKVQKITRVINLAELKVFTWRFVDNMNFK